MGSKFLILATTVLIFSTVLLADGDKEYERLNWIVTQPTLTFPLEKTELMAFGADETDRPYPFLVKDWPYDQARGETWDVYLTDRTPDGVDSWRICARRPFNRPVGPWLGYDLEGNSPGLKIVRKEGPGTVWRIERREKGGVYFTVAEGKWKGWYLNFSDREEKKELQFGGMLHRFTQRRGELTEKPGERSLLAIKPVSRRRS